MQLWTESSERPVDEIRFEFGANWTRFLYLAAKSEVLANATELQP